MLNYFRFKKFNGQYLLTNDFGRYIFLDQKQLRDLATGNLQQGTELWDHLEREGFVFAGSVPAFTAENTYQMRDCKNYLFAATSLHIFVVTTACNMNCVYCQANSGSRSTSGYMSRETAMRAVDVALQSPARRLTFEFQGGEPLLNFSVIRAIVEYAESKKADKHIQYSVVSNLTLLTDEMIAFFAQYQVGVSTSLDGPGWLHNANRPYCNERTGTYTDVVAGVEKLRAAGIVVGAIQTTTKQSLAHAREIVDTYYDNGFNHVFLRPLTPLGCASQQWKEIGYTPDEFIRFYQEALTYILEKNKQGDRLQEGHAAIFLSGILHGYPINYMELRSPCGAAVGQMAYYYNGDVFTCDEGRMLYEMGNDSFRLGNVNEQQYSDLVCSSACRAICLSSVTEAIPACCDCVYQPYCGICPVVNLALYHDLMPKTPNHYRCGIYGGMLDTLFGWIQKNDEKIMKILESWYA